jgi:hypothetical protein
MWTGRAHGAYFHWSNGPHASIMTINIEILRDPITKKIWKITAISPVILISNLQILSD